jgi:hypothetical protein
MFPLVTVPLALVGLVGLPTLIAIYWLRNRFRRQPVSSLMLWIDPSESRSGGPRVRRLQTPWLLLLELLAVLLLVLAAADPYLPGMSGSRPIVVVLDDSFSMLAGGADSPRQRAAKALIEEIRRRNPYTTRLVLAGERPQALGDAVHTPAEVAGLLDGWRCQGAAADLDAAVALAGELGGEYALLLVVTDREPDPPPTEEGRLRWWAFGKPRENLAVTAAARLPAEGGDRLLVEVTNFSGEGRAVELSVERLDPDGKPAGVLQVFPLELAAGEPRRLTLLLPEGTGAVRARLPDDELDFDNTASLLSPPRRSVRFDVRVTNATLRSLVERALDATGVAVRKAESPDVLVTDAADAPEGTPADAWRVFLLAEKEAGAFAGPFVLDRGHPLTDGLSLRGTVWGGGEGTDLPGAPVVLAGNVPLLTDTESAGRHDLRWRFRPDLSTLQNGPNWPVLWWNLCQWHAGQQPGPARVNLRLGEDAVLTLGDSRDRLTLAGPDGPPRDVAVQARRAVFRPAGVGVYTLSGNGVTQSFAVSALAPAESDLRGAAEGKWGDWLDATALRLEYQSIAWVLIGLALVVLVLHLLVARLGSR